jgi:alpha-D-xyloside xylohydrolase
VPEIRDCASLEDLYRRIQVAIFAPVAQVNCWYMNFPPWLQIEAGKNNRGNFMADHEEATAVVRRLFELRMSLIPYLYSAYHEYRNSGTPPLRALVMDWPDDPRTRGVDDQFLVGPSLMVAPIFAGQAKRKVYLPKGRWHDYWTREVYEGGRVVDVAKPLDQVPRCVKNDTCFELTVQVYGPHPAAFMLLEDDGTTYDFEKGKQNRIELAWAGGNGSWKKTGAYDGPARYKLRSFEVISDGQKR